MGQLQLKNNAGSSCKDEAAVKKDDLKLLLDRC